MGQDTSNSKHTRNKHLHFVSALLEDITALEKMIADGLLESDIERIGAEQEICIVNENFSPGDNSIDLLQKIQDPQFTTELAKYNIEINLTPRTCIEGGLIAMENELLEKFIVARNHASALNSHLVIAGILPTISRKEITLDYLTPKERYH
ncbi:MAG TPA: hypothetical protein PKE14_12320, partial [Chitinophagales bacterium]|nr:hypothetical protein [Chitinophagales bacterium]